MSNEAERAAKRRYWARRMQDPEKRAKYLEYQRQYFRETMADPAARLWRNYSRKELALKAKARNLNENNNQP